VAISFVGGESHWIIVLKSIVDFNILYFNFHVVSFLLKENKYGFSVVAKSSAE
jgi:hypothetical protein